VSIRVTHHALLHFLGRCGFAGGDDPAAVPRRWANACLFRVLMGGRQATGDEAKAVSAWLVRAKWRDRDSLRRVSVENVVVCDRHRIAFVVAYDEDRDGNPVATVTSAIPLARAVGEFRRITCRRGKRRAGWNRGMKSIES